MADDQANADEGASPVNDIKKQNPGEMTTGDITGEAASERSGAAEGSDNDEGDEEQGKTEALTKAGRSGFDPNDGQE